MTTQTEQALPQERHTAKFESMRVADYNDGWNAALAACKEALAAPQLSGNSEQVHNFAPDGATHYQPHQKTYYKRVSATEWYLWSCTGKGWIRSKGTSDTAEWVTLHETALAAPQDKSDNYLNGYCTGRTDLLKELAAQQGEPVAYMGVSKITGARIFNVYQPPEYIDKSWDVTPLYTHPAPAPLSDEDIAEIVDRNWGSAWDAKAFVPIVREIERHVRGEG